MIVPTGTVWIIFQSARHWHGVTTIGIIRQTQLVADSTSDMEEVVKGTQESGNVTKKIQASVMLTWPPGLTFLSIAEFC
jgi:hypothetical protein